jgi:hypothetical protein
VIYSAYGPTLISSVAVSPLKPFSPAISSRDVQIDIASRDPWVSWALAQPVRVLPTRRFYSHEENSRFTLEVHQDGLFFHLVYADGTHFLVDREATRVWGEAGANLGDDDVFVYLLGPVMGFILRKHGCLALHASVVELGGLAFALTGSSSSDKFTTAAALALRGVPVLTEDVTPIKESGHSFVVQPGYPRVCLWPDSVKQLLGSADALPLVTPNWNKRYLPLDGMRANFETHPKPLGAIYLLSPRVNNSDAPRIEEMSPSEGLFTLVQNTYMNYLLDRHQRAAEFDILAKLVDCVPVRRIIPHADPARLPVLCDLIIEDAMALSPTATTCLPQSA